MEPVNNEPSDVEVMLSGKTGALPPTCMRLASPCAAIAPVDSSAMVEAKIICRGVMFRLLAYHLLARRGDDPVVPRRLKNDSPVALCSCRRRVPIESLSR